MDDPFLQNHDASELEIAGEFLTNWLPFLTGGLCDRCSHTLADRVRSLRPDPAPAESSECAEPIHSSGRGADPDPNADSLPSEQTEESPSWKQHVEATGWGTDPEPEQEADPEPEPEAEQSPHVPKVRMSWADMAQEEDELAEEEERARERSGSEGKKKVSLPREQREWIRFKSVGRKKDFICLERVKGKLVNILDGLELHTGVFSAVEQKRIVDFVYELQEKGRKSEFGERTYSEPRKWMPGKGRVTIQFGCCYNYAMDKDGNPPGILKNVRADPIPSLFKVIIRRLVRWHVLPASCVPNSCIVNIYEPGDCIPPHIDSHDFVRPFSTVSFLSECNILFGSNLKVEGAGEFSGSTAIPLPMGSVLVLNGNGADIAKHCVPAVPTKRISITFRKMDETKHPIDFSPELDLQNIQPLPDKPVATEFDQGSSTSRHGLESRNLRKGKKYRGRSVGSQYLSDDPEATPTVRPRQVIDARSATSGDNSMGRGINSAGRSYESSTGRGGDMFGRSYDSKTRSSQDGPGLRHDFEHSTRRLPQQEWADDSSSHSEAGMELNGSGRRVRLDHQRIVISRNMEGERETGSRSFDQGILGPYRPGRRRVRVVIDDQ